MEWLQEKCEDVKTEANANVNVKIHYWSCCAMKCSPLCYDLVQVLFCLDLPGGDHHEETTTIPVVIIKPDYVCV